MPDMQKLYHQVVRQGARLCGHWPVRGDGWSVGQVRGAEGELRRRRRRVHCSLRTNSAQSQSDHTRGRACAYDPGFVATISVKCPLNERFAPNIGAGCSAVYCVFSHTIVLCITRNRHFTARCEFLGAVTAVRLTAREGEPHLPGGMSPVHHRSRTHRWSQGWCLSCSERAACRNFTRHDPYSAIAYALFWSHLADINKSF